MLPLSRHLATRLAARLVLPLALLCPPSAQAELTLLGPLSREPLLIERNALFGEFIDRYVFDLAADPPRDGVFVRVFSPIVLLEGIDLAQTSIGGLLIEFFNPDGTLGRSEFATRDGSNTFFLDEFRADPNNGEGYVLQISGIGSGVEGGRYRLDLGIVDNAFPDLPEGDPGPTPDGPPPGAVPIPASIWLVLLALGPIAATTDRRRRDRGC